MCAEFDWLVFVPLIVGALCFASANRLLSKTQRLCAEIRSDIARKDAEFAIRALKEAS